MCTYRKGNKKVFLFRLFVYLFSSTFGRAMSKSFFEAGGPSKNNLSAIRFVFRIYQIYKVDRILRNIIHVVRRRFVNVIRLIIYEKEKKRSRRR